MSRPGRKYKAGVERTRVLVGVMPEHHAAYKKLGEQLGLPLTDVIAYLACKGAGQPVPEYIARTIEENENRAQDVLLDQAALVA